MQLRRLFTPIVSLNTDPDRITIMGDSAGGNLAAAVCMMARDRGDFFPKKQILIYPALNNCIRKTLHFESVKNKWNRLSSHSGEDGRLSEIL